MAKQTDIRGWFFKITYKLRRHFIYYLTNIPVHIICFLKGVKVGKKVQFNGAITIHREPGSVISIDDGCIFNSARHSVPIRLAKPNVFYTLSKNAEIIFGKNSGASGSTFVAVKRITIGENVMIGVNTSIIDNDFHNTNPVKRDLYNREEIPSNPVSIGNNVFIGFNCTILKGVTIGDNSVIGANSVVLSSIPSNSIAIGNPCKVILKRNWKNAGQNNEDNQK